MTECTLNDRETLHYCEPGGTWCRTETIAGWTYEKSLPEAPDCYAAA